MECALALVVLYGVGTNLSRKVGAGWRIDLIREPIPECRSQPATACHTEPAERCSRRINHTPVHRLFGTGARQEHD
jgi:hypothetical protein